MLRIFACLAAVSFLMGCSSASSPASAGPSLAGDAQTPPTGGAAVQAWLAAGHYLAWHCEPASRPGRVPSPHGAARVCSNDIVAAAGGAGPYPAGAASVKEIYDVVGGKIIGYAVDRKLEAASAAGSGWYWFESDPFFSADGVGGSAGEGGSCTGCHAVAGPGFATTARDFVFTQVD